jgi:hypothetical protein
MFIHKVISFNSAWNILLNKDKAYDDICTAISKIDSESLSDPEICSQPHRNEQRERIEINPYNFSRCWERMVENLG